MATRFQIKRSTVSGVVPTTGDIANGELAVNLADRKLFTSNGSAVLELGSNLANLSVTGNVTVKGVIANGSLGTSGQVLHSNGTSTYWAADDAGVTSVATGNGLTGGTITTTGTISVIANSGLSANATGVYVVPGNGLVAANSTGVHVGAGSGITVNSTAVSVLANNGLSANATGVYVVPGNGLIAANSTGVHVGAGNGISVNSTAVAVLANNGITANATGLYVTQGTGTVVNATGVHVNSSYIGTLTANNATNLNGQPASYYTNATNITTGTLATARLPATANITTAVNVGANVNLSTTQISVGNSTVNVVINSSAISVTSDPLVQQSDIGTDPNQIPLNQYLGTLAYQSDTIAVSNVFAIGSAGYFAANGNVGIGTASPSVKLDVNSTDGIRIPIGNTAQRPTTSNGMIRYNTDTGFVEAVANSTWTNLVSSYSSVRQQFTASSNQTSFTITGGYTPGQIDVYRNGVKMVPGTDANVSSGTAVVLTAPAANNDTVEVVGFTTVTITDVVKKSGDTMTGNLVVSGTISDSIGNVRDVPINSQTVSYQIATTDAGKTISSNAGITVNGAILYAGFMVSIFNNSAANITITSGANTTMYLAGTATTGNRTLAQRGFATVQCVAANTFVITGAGVT